MEPYALIPGAGPFAASADLFTVLVEELQSAEAAGLTACELEDLLAGRGREVPRQLAQDHLDPGGAREGGRCRGGGWGPGRAPGRCGPPEVPPSPPAGGGGRGGGSGMAPGRFPGASPRRSSRSRGTA